MLEPIAGQLFQFRNRRQLFASLNGATNDMVIPEGELCIFVNRQSKPAVETRQVWCFWLLLSNGCLVNTELTIDGFWRLFSPLVTYEKC